MPNSPITESLILSPVMERAPEEAEEVQDVEPSPSAAWIYPWTSTYVPNIST
ncbi:MAG: hypothetical protein KAI07_11055 [Deltaproteobacteria bacterium]|nr:hypothetical protein [Deltaproteobacteria bacterium]